MGQLSAPRGSSLLAKVLIVKEDREERGEQIDFEGGGRCMQLVPNLQSRAELRGREALAVPMRAGPALGPFQIHLHSFKGKIKESPSRKSGH